MTYTDTGTDMTSTRMGWALKFGVIGGIVAGVIFAMAEMVGAWFLQGKPLLPLHLIASIPLQTPPTNIGTLSAVVVGTITHMFFSMVFGVVAALFVVLVDALRRSPTATTVFASVYGLILWLVNFYLLAEFLNVPWFYRQTNPALQFVAHTFFFGTALGLFLAAQLPAGEPARSYATEPAASERR